MHIALQPLNKQCPREVGRSAACWFLCCWWVRCLMSDTRPFNSFVRFSQMSCYHLNNWNGIESLVPQMAASVTRCIKHAHIQIDSHPLYHTGKGNSKQMSRGFLDDSNESFKSKEHLKVVIERKQIYKAICPYWNDIYMLYKSSIHVLCINNEAREQVTKAQQQWFLFPI